MNKKIVVIGGGLAGSLLCNVLVENCDVTLLEIGSKNIINFPEINFHNKKFAEVPTFCNGGGGTTNLWHNGLIPINSEDVVDPEFREALVASEPFMDRAAEALFFTAGNYTAEHQRLKDEVNSLSDILSVFPSGIDCLVYPKKFHKLSVSSQVKAVYSVSDIDFMFEDGRVVKINYSAEGQRKSIEADNVIVCAGTLGTPGIIQKIVAAAAFPFENVGLGFIDHPMGFVGKVRFNKEIVAVIKKLSLLDRATYVSRNAVRLKSECGRYTSCAFFRPALTMNNQLEIYKYKSSLGASNGLTRLKNIFSWKLFHPDIIAEIFAHVFGVNIPSRTYNILFIAEQKRGNNRVYFEGDKLQVDWSISPEELSIYQKMLEDFQNQLSTISEKVNIKTDITEDWLWSAAHHSCTTPLGFTENDLIDKNLKLKFCDNVYVCDGSVIQEHSYANTGLAIGQLAFRLAEHLNNKTVPRAEHAKSAEKT